MNFENYYTTGEIAKILKMRADGVSRLLNARKIGRRIGKRIYVKESELRALLGEGVENAESKGK